MNKMIKMKSWIAIVSTVVVLFGCAKEDFSSEARSEIFIKYFGSERAEVVIEMVKLFDDVTPDDGIDDDRYLILGTTTFSQTSDVGDRDIMMVMTDGAGNRIWETRQDFSADSVIRGDDIPSKVLLNSQDNTRAWVIGTSDYGEVDESILILEIDVTNGSIINSNSFQYYDDRSALASTHKGVETRGVDLVEDGTSLIILGSVKTGIDELSSGANNYSIFLASIVNDANILTGDYQSLSVNWDQFDGFDTGNDHGIKLIKDNDEFFYVASTEIPADQNRSKVMIKWFDSADGNEISDARRIGTSNNDIPTSIISDQYNLYITGRSGENRAERAFFIRISKSLQNNGVFRLVEADNVGTGDFLGSLTPTVDEGNRGQDIVKLDNGNFYIVGTLKNHVDDRNVLKQDEIFLTEVNGNGEVIDGTTQVYGSDEIDQGNAVWLNSDGSIVIGGTIGFGGVATMMALIKTNDEGKLKN